MPTDAQRAQTAFLAAADIADPAARARYLDEACGGDAGLRARVEALLRAHDNPDSLLDRPAVSPPEPGHVPTRDFPAADADPAATRTVGPEGSETAGDEVPLGFLAPPTRPDSLGRIGHYEVLQVLGHGGFGIVFRAFDEVLHRVVAVKVLAPQMAATSPARKRFLREARSSAQVRHEHVVQVYEVGEQPLPFIVMEFIPGETLQQRLDRMGPVEPAEVVRVGRQVAEGLAAAHAQDLIHRDIKPGNILLEGGAGRVKITDFGLARAADDASISQSGVIAGTPMYMAPEQAKGEKLDQRADLFSLGSVLYQMAAGRPPFRANGTVAVLKRVAEDTPRDIREIVPEVPQWLCDIISKLHAKSPDERYQTAREVADVLADCEAQLKAHTKLKDFSRIPSGETPARPRAPSSWVVVAAVGLLAVVGVGAVAVLGVTYLSRGEPPAAGPVLAGGNPAEGVGPKHAPPPVPVPVARPQPLPPTFTSGIGMEFVIVPKGKAWLGGGKDRLGDQEVEIPADFYLGKYEVTQEEWEKVMGENPSHFSRTGGGKDAVQGIADAGLKRFPVENVSWNECQAFVAKLNEQAKETGWVYRLPTDTEWEYACRGGPMADKSNSAFDFYFAAPTNTLSPDKVNTNYGLSRTREVGAYEANRLGLCDMHGNVWEWGHSRVKQPSHAGLQGGGWDSETTTGLLARYRAMGPPDYRSSNLGLRLARVPSGAPSPAPKTPPVAADVRKDAVLLMTFEKDTFYQKDGKTYVRDLSGNDKDGLCENVEFTPDGKAGGGLLCKEGEGRLQLAKSLINGQPNYTITAWCQWDKRTGPGTGTNLYRTHGVFGIGIPPERSVVVNTWNRDLLPKNWKNFSTNAGAVPAGWFFVAVSLTDGEIDNGKLRIVIDDKILSRTSQMVATGNPVVDAIGHNMGGAVIDELAVFQRSLSDEEIAAVRALGMKGTPSNVGQVPPAVAPFTDADVKRIATLPAAEQVEEVRKELVRRNPAFDGTLTPTVGNGVTGLKFSTAGVVDIGPVRALEGLTSLACAGTHAKGGTLSDLGPLAGLPLTSVDLSFTRVRDLGPLRGMPLTTLLLTYSQVRDLTPLTGMRLETLQAQAVPASDLSPLEGMPLTSLDLHRAVGVTDLRPLRGMPLVYLNLSHLTVSDLSPLRGLKSLERLVLHDMEQLSDLKPLEGLRLTELDLRRTRVADLTPLKGMELRQVALPPVKGITRGLDTLRGMASLATIRVDDDRQWPAAEFWERYDKGEFGTAPLPAADGRRVTAVGTPPHRKGSNGPGEWSVFASRRSFRAAGRPGSYSVAYRTRRAGAAEV